MEGLARWFGSLRFRFGLAILIGGLVVLAGSGLLRLEFDDNHRKFFRGSGDAYEQLEVLAGMFPMDENDFIVLLESDDLFSRERVEGLRRLDGALREMEGVLGVYSIFDARSEKLSGLTLPPLMPKTGASEEEFGKVREAALAHGVAMSQIIAGPLWDEAEAKIRVEESYDRSLYPEGALFQMAAIAASGDRTEGLHGVDLPFLVIHGLADQLISVSGGQATATAVPGADLLVLAKMGHDLPRAYWAQLTSAIHGISTRQF